MKFGVRNGAVGEPKQEAHDAGDVDEQPRGRPAVRQRHPRPDHVAQGLRQSRIPRSDKYQRSLTYVLGFVYVVVDVAPGPLAPEENRES